MVQVYEVDNKYAEVQKLLENRELCFDEEKAPSWKEALEKIDGTTSEKVQAVVAMIKSLESNAKVIKLEEERLYDRRKGFEELADGAREWAATQMGAEGTYVVKNPLFTISLQEGKKSVKVLNIEGLVSLSEAWRPYDYSKESNVDKKVLRELIEEGKVPTEVASVVTGNRYIIVK